MTSNIFEALAAFNDLTDKAELKKKKKLEAIMSKIDSDWEAAFSFGLQKIVACEGYQGDLNVTMKDIKKIIKWDAGENDGPNWICVGKLKNNRWFFLTAGCDYTGWDCQAGGMMYIGSSEKMIKQMGCDADARDRLYGTKECEPFDLNWIIEK